jgi:hypothetical protein
LALGDEPLRPSGMVKEMRYLALVAALALTACVNEEDRQMVDQCLRRQYFMQCLKVVPPGPEKTVYNDWDEVVGKCEDVAYYQAVRKSKFVKEECRPR